MKTNLVGEVIFLDGTSKRTDAMAISPLRSLIDIKLPNLEGIHLKKKSMPTAYRRRVTRVGVVLYRCFIHLADNLHCSF